MSEPIKMLSSRSYPNKVILHVDCDAFFVGCEQAVHPHLKGLPVMTGAERGIVAACSYEAKARGVTRGMRTFEARQVCPGIVVLASDYETYSMFSLRMFEILRRFSPTVEEYSVDESFLDITGLRRTFNCSYPEIAKRIQDTIEQELDLSVSIGLSVSKVLAKVGSKHNKPHGITSIPARQIHTYLEKLPVGKIWGIGHNTAAFLNKQGVISAYDFAIKNEAWVKNKLSKPYIEIWHELNGRSVYEVTTEEKSEYKSISKCKTFTPPSIDKSYVYAQLVRNLESACIKLRRHKLTARSIVIFIKTQEFSSTAIELHLTSPTANPLEIIGLVKTGFESLFEPNTPYRTTGIVLTGLKANDCTQLSLFDDPVELERQTNLQTAVDEVADKYGKHTLCIGAALPVRIQKQHGGERGMTNWRRENLLEGEDARQHLDFALLGSGV